MDHGQIEERDVVERYVQGTLPPSEAEAFEEHLVGCAACFERVRWTESFGGALRAAAAQEVAAAVAGAGLLAWLRRPGTLRRAGLALTALTALGLLPAYLLREQVREGRARAELSGELADARRLLAGERAARERAEEESRRLAAPQVNTPIFTFGVSRGEEPGGPVNRMSIAPGTTWVVLAVELAAAEHTAYSATLTRAGRTVWSGDGLVPGAEQSLVISLPASALTPGDYALRLEGRMPSGGTAPAGTISFRVGRS